MQQQQRQIKSSIARSGNKRAPRHRANRYSHAVCAVLTVTAVLLVALGSPPQDEDFMLANYMYSYKDTSVTVATVSDFASKAEHEPDEPDESQSSSLSEPETSQQAPQASRTPQHPRIIQIDFHSNHPVPIDYSQQFNLIDPPFRHKLKTIGRAVNGLPGRHGCVPFEWQTQRYQSCNTMHETQLSGLTFITCGSKRCVFEFVENDGTPRVMKVQMFDEDMSEMDLEYARRDALAMERLTSSPYVASIFGACGTSQVVEFSPYGNLFDWMKLTRHGQRELPTPIEKLKFGIQISTAVADVHSIDQDKGLLSLTHNDVCCHQFIMVDGVFKLGDFHLSRFHKKNAFEAHATCEERPPRMNAVLGKIRAPEEQAGRVMMDLEKVDVFLMTDVMFYVLTQKWMFEDITTPEAEKRLGAGGRPEFGFEPTDPADIAMAKAVTWGWTHKPTERPTAREMSDFLKDALKQIEGRKDDYVVRAPVPPLPKDYDFSDLEFYQNLGRTLNHEVV